MSQSNIAVIGGTGLDSLPEDIFAEPVMVSTRSGDVPVLSVSNNYTEPYKLYFLARHGARHGIPPHKIDYRANIEALSKLDVTHIIASNAVGTLRRDLPPGSLVVLDDFIDFTRSRDITYFDGLTEWQHIDFSVPYSPTVREAILSAARDMELPVTPRGTYLCTDGPRFESPAEVRLFASWGADVIGMTGLPELVFAREAGIQYGAVGIVTNYGAGLVQGQIDHLAVTDVVRGSMPILIELFMRASGNIIGSLLTGATTKETDV